VTSGAAAGRRASVLTGGGTAIGRAGANGGGVRHGNGGWLGGR
jgi:hypothetical protein